MRDIKERFETYSLFKKILFFNAYAIVLAIVYFITALALSPIFQSPFGDLKFMDSIIYYLNDFGSYIQSLVWGYFMALFALFTPLFSNKTKK